MIYKHVKQTETGYNSLIYVILWWTSILLITIHNKHGTDNIDNTIPRKNSFCPLMHSTELTQMLYAKTEADVKCREPGKKRSKRKTKHILFGVYRKLFFVWLDSNCHVLTMWCWRSSVIHPMQGEARSCCLLPDTFNDVTWLRSEIDNAWQDGICMIVHGNDNTSLSARKWNTKHCMGWNTQN